MRPHLLPRLLLIPLLALAACGDGEGGSGEPIQLTRSGGCGEAFLWAANQDGTVVVSVGVEVPRYSTRESVKVDVDLPDPDVDAVLLRGDTDMTRNLCVDVIEDEAEPDETIPLRAGTGEVTISPIPTDVSACGNLIGTLQLTDVEAEDGTVVGEVNADTDDIGCFAG